MRKQKKILIDGLHILLASISLPALCQGLDPDDLETGNETKLPDISVTGRLYGPEYGFSWAGPTGPTATTPVLRLKSQGGRGAQTDLSIRGSSFSGAGLAIAGLPLTNPQTEHFHSELPFPSALFLQPRILTGLERKLDSGGHLVGTVGFEFAPAARRRGLLLEAGEAERNSQDLFLQEDFSSGLLTGAAFFLSRETSSENDYKDNGLDRVSGGFHLQAGNDALRADLAFGRQNKQFGARGYYGVNDALPAEEEVDDTMAIVSLRYSGNEGRYTRLTASHRRLKDEYTLFLEGPDYRNSNKSRVSSAAIDGRDGLFVRDLEIYWRVSGFEEDLNSSSLGDHKRETAKLTLTPEARLGSLALAAGGEVNAFSGESPEILPLAGLSFDFNGNSRASISYTEAVRQPSFTELNYESPGSLGNAGLTAQKSAGLTAGIHFGTPGNRIYTGAFARESRNTIDWVKATNNAPRWMAADLGTVETAGLEVEVVKSLGSSLRLSGGYMLIDKDVGGEWHAGRYVLDYAEHEVALAAEWNAGKQLRVLASQSLSKQVRNPERSGGRTAKDGTVRALYSPAGLRGTAFIVQVENVWNDRFEVLPGLGRAGRRFGAGMQMAW